jgi:hypothetical protein
MICCTSCEGEIIMNVNAEMTRAKFTRVSDRIVTIEYDDYKGDRVTREYTISHTRTGEAYVRDPDGRQVCQALRGVGNPLTATPSTLIEVIRAEYRAMCRAEQRERAQ